MNKNEVKISFGIIVLNGEPFIKYNLRALYPFAHEILIVEGATKNSKETSTEDGHSTDSTLNVIKDFIETEDTDKKIKLITRDGFWEEKDEMSRQFVKEITGNYLWQIDVDEFYLEEDVTKIIEILKNDSSISGISFKMKSFWGGIYQTEEGTIFGDIYRIFKFKNGYNIRSHRPPVVEDEKGNDLKILNWLDGYTMEKKYGIFMYHYSLIFPEQVRRKALYYKNLLNKVFDNWMENSYFSLKKPFRVNNNFWKISWLKKYNGKHNSHVIEMMNDIQKGTIKIELRRNDDIEKLLNSIWYRVSTLFLSFYVRLVSELKYVVKKAIKNKWLRVTLLILHRLVTQNIRRLRRGLRRNRAVVLAYHRVFEDKFDPLLLCVSPKKFEKQMKYIKSKFNVISLSQLVSDLENNTLRKNSICVTFDDGYIDNLTLALPILEKYEIPATVFVTAGKIGDEKPFYWDIYDEKTLKYLSRPLNNDELIKLANSPLIEIGSHTTNHKRLSELSYSEQNKELLDSKVILENYLGKKVNIFSYPFGTSKDFNNDSIEISKNLFICACACEEGYIDLDSNIYKLPRNTVRNWSILKFKIYAL